MVDFLSLPITTKSEPTFLEEFTLTMFRTLILVFLRSLESSLFVQRMSYTVLHSQEMPKGNRQVIDKQGINAFRADKLWLISLHSATSKVIERFVQRRLQDYVRIFHLLVPEEFGFRVGHSGTHQLLRLVECPTRKPGVGNNRR